MAGCCYGIEYSGFGAITFTNSPFDPNNIPLFPSQIVSSLFMLIFGIILLVWCNKHKHKPGDIGTTYILVYGLARSFIENYRGDLERGFILGMSTSQFICIFLFFTGLVLKIPTPSLPKLPHFSLETSSKEILGKTITYPTGFDVEWYAKAMNNPYLFTQPTIVGAGEAGAEVMYGRDSLMRDIAQATAANNDSLIEGMYLAMSQALRQADLTVEINEREFGRIVREARL